MTNQSFRISTVICALALFGFLLRFVFGSSSKQRVERVATAQTAPPSREGLPPPPSEVSIVQQPVPSTQSYSAIFHPLSQDHIVRHPSSRSRPSAPVLPPKVVESSAAVAPAMAVAPSVRVWVGGNMNYQALSSRLDSEISSGFHSLKGVGLAMGLGFDVDDWSADVSYRGLRGSVQSSADTQIRGGDYQWSILDAIASWRAFSSKSWALAAGVSQQQSPLLYPDTGDGLIYMRKIELTTINFGLHWRSNVKATDRFEVSAMYRYPAHAGTLDRASISVHPRLSGFAEVEYIHPLKKHIHLTVQLRTDLQDINYKYRDLPNADETSGRQSLSSTSLGVMMGAEF